MHSASGQFIYFVLGVAVSVISTYLFSPYFRDLILDRVRSIPWRSIDKVFRSTTWLGHISDAMPDVIVALNDGIVPAAFVARNLRIHDVHYVVHDFDRKSGQVEVSTLSELKADLRGKRILLIDDQIYSGRGMEAVYARLLSLGAEPESINRAALFRYENAPYRPPLEIEAPRSTRGTVKVAPWSYTPAHRRRYEHDTHSR